MQEIYDRIRGLQIEYEYLKERMVDEEKENDELFMQGEMMKTEYPEYALNFGVVWDYPQERLFDEVTIWEAITNKRVDELFVEIERCNESLRSEIQDCREINRKLTDVLIRGGKIKFL